MKLYEKDGVYLTVGAYELEFYRLMSIATRGKCQAGHKPVKRKVGGKRYTLPPSNCSVFCSKMGKKELKSILDKAKKQHNNDKERERIDRKAEAWFKRHGFHRMFEVS